MSEVNSVPYAKFAKYYDLLGWSEFSEMIYPMILKFFSKLDKIPSDYLDLACGTGVLAYMLAEHKIKITGIDISPQMICEAQAKKSSGQFKPRFMIGDITNFNLGQKFEMAGCFFDSINHLKSRAAIKKAFHCASKHLRPDGWFLFDMVTDLGLRNWKDFHQSKDNIYYVAQEARFNADENRVQVKIEAFINDNGKSTIHIKEMFNEICLPLDLTYKYLTQTGFAKIIIKAFPPAETVDLAERVMIYAKK
jgi:SAM-dependent methyltransferase